MPTSTISPFKNEPILDFSIKENEKDIQKALKKVKAELNQDYPLYIGSEKIETKEKITSINPGKLDEVVGRVSKTDKDLAEKAMDAAWKTFESWKNVPAEERADYLFKAAEILRQRRHEFSAWMIYEAGKNYLEADAEVAEAIDFMEFYGRQMIRLSEGDKDLIRMEGEDNHLTYIPLGVGVVHPPWNFPFAITIGLTTSAIVSGNTVLLKPAHVTPVVAHKFIEVMQEVGLPSGVINFIPGDPSEIGDYLTSHPKTRFVSFTGSKDVGLRIMELAGKTEKGQKWIKRVNAEMGGKDGVVVDETVDLDEAADSIIYSAFGFQGQKCSAGSRAIIVESVYDELVEKVLERAKKFEVGPGEENYSINAVIEQKAYDKIMKYIEIGKKEGRLALGGEELDKNGYYIQPTIFTDVNHNARIMKEEIFGPVLAMTKVQDWKEAIDVYNDTDFGLTGSFFSQDEERIDYAIQNMYCGNLYINRNCTGAFVGVHPFGGFNMSGTDSKAGGNDYLKIFMQPKTYSRKK